jgi:hypothetical protein
VVKARRAISWIGVSELGYSGADVARYLGVPRSWVTQMISTGKKQDINAINLDLGMFCTNIPYFADKLSFR